jgi:hypothetical protein
LKGTWKEAVMADLIPLFQNLPSKTDGTLVNPQDSLSVGCEVNLGLSVEAGVVNCSTTTFNFHVYYIKAAICISCVGYRMWL